MAATAYARVSAENLVSMKASRSAFTTWYDASSRNPCKKEQERRAALAGRHARDEGQQPLETGQAGMVGVQAVSASVTDATIGAATTRPRLLSDMNPPGNLPIVT